MSIADLSIIHLLFQSEAFEAHFLWLYVNSLKILFQFCFNVYHKTYCLLKVSFHVQTERLSFNRRSICDWLTACWTLALINPRLSSFNISPSSARGCEKSAVFHKNVSIARWGLSLLRHTAQWRIVILALLVEVV